MSIFVASNRLYESRSGRQRLFYRGEMDVLLTTPIDPEAFALLNPLLDLDNAFVTPHRASKTSEAQKRTAMWAVNDILRVIRGERPRRLVNPQVFGEAEF